MDLGIFMMPSHPPERTPIDAAEWDLQMIRWADEYGFSEAWIGEHFTAPWEPVPSPDLLIAQSLRETSNIRLGAGAHLLPFHHPAELACRVAYLDHLSRGRLMLGIGSSSLPSDWATFNVDGRAGQTREMTAESLEIMTRLWTSDEPFEYKGKFWDVNRIGEMVDGLLAHHIQPFQRPHPPIGVTGLSSPSPTLEMAGERGFLPMSLNFNTQYIRSHWDSVLAGAARTGQNPSRSDWRLVREVIVADTDKEARKLAVDGYLGRFMREYLLPFFSAFGFQKYLKHDANVPDSEVTVDYVADHNWILGSPDTVVERLTELYDEMGGFGKVIITGLDYSTQPEAWQHSMRLLGQEVLPRVSSLVPSATAATE